MEKLNSKDIKPAPYNPREITEVEYKGLTYSMDKFNDISGIVFNKTTGNLIGGHHRWRKLAEEFTDLSINHVKGEFYSIDNYKDFTGYFMRVVEWDKSTEKAANVTANSHTVAGKFNVDILSSLLEEIKIESPEVYKETNVKGLELDLQINFDTNWDTPAPGGDSNLDGIEGRIVVNCKEEDKDKVLTFLKDTLKETGYEGLTIK